MTTFTLNTDAHFKRGLAQLAQASYTINATTAAYNTTNTAHGAVATTTTPFHI